MRWILMVNQSAVKAPWPLSDDSPGMKFFFYIFCTSLFLQQPVIAQQPAVTKVKLVTYHNQVMAGPAFPVGQFGETHFPGITASYIRINRQTRTSEQAGQKKTGWIMASSLSHFFGKKESIGNGTFRYSGYSLLDLQGGIAWYPKQRVSFAVRTGPGLGYYKKVFRFTVTGQLQGSYTISPKITITPGCFVSKEPGSDVLWSPSLQLGFMF
jgi:hypothetical protein